MRTQLLVMLMFLAGCRATQDSSVTLLSGNEADEANPPEHLAGNYYRGDGTGHNVNLNLKDDGTYAAEWHGCLGKYGDAAGQWRFADDAIRLKPTHETGMMEGHLRQLTVVSGDSGAVLVPAGKDERYFRDVGVTRYSCFQKRAAKPD